MSDSPLVSVILPFYKSPNLRRAIESILAQTYPHFELLLINNNSPMDVLQVAEKYLKDSRVVIMHEPRQGVVFAMNRGISYAKGSFIVRMDSDDTSYADRLELQLAAFVDDPALEVVSGLVTYEGPEQHQGFRVYVDWLNTVRSPEEIRLNQFVEFPLVNPSLMVRKSVFETHGLFEDGDFPEDYELFLRLQQSGVKMAKVSTPVLKWMDSNERLTRTDPRYAVDAFFKIKARYLANWLEKNIPHHPHILVWGAGRLSRKRSSYLLQYGIEIEGYIDVKKQKGIIHYQDVANHLPSFIVSYVTNRGARDQIRTFLVSMGLEEGKQFILAS